MGGNRRSFWKMWPLIRTVKEAFDSTAGQRTKSLPKGWLLWVSFQSLCEHSPGNTVCILFSVLGDPAGLLRNALGNVVCVNPLYNSYKMSTLHQLAMAAEFKDDKDWSELRGLELCRLQGALVMFWEEVPLVTSYSCISL